MIAIIDYGVGNLFSLTGSLRAIQENPVVTRDKKIIEQADAMILPGVGAFGDAVQKLKETGMYEVVKEEAIKGKKILGICVGMQLLFEKSLEFGEHEGLGLIEGKVEAIQPKLSKPLAIPHIGWNRLQMQKTDCLLFQGIDNGSYAYFVHSYAAFGCDAYVCAYTDYEIPLVAAVQKGNVYGTQFHPEKSGAIGLKILRNFCANS